MNFHYSTSTTHRPQNSSSNFNEDAHCDNEVNLILEKNYNQQIIEQAIFVEQQKQHQHSAVASETDQYYFMPIREQVSTMALPSNNDTNLTDSSVVLLSDLNKSSKKSLFDYSSSTTSKIVSSDSELMNKLNNNNSNNYSLTDDDLAALFASSIVTTTPSAIGMDDKNQLSNKNNTLDDVFLQQVNDHTCVSQPNTVEPPPGFENFLFDTSFKSDNSISLSSINNISLQTQLSSDTTNFSQLLKSTSVDTQQPPIIGTNVHSSSSSHSPFSSDEQSIFFPMSNQHYSISSSSQIFPANSSSSSTSNTIATSTITTAAKRTNSTTKSYQPNSLSLNPMDFSSIDPLHRTSPISTKPTDTGTINNDGDMTSNNLFTTSNSFVNNDKSNLAPKKPSTSKSSSSTSSSTSSSIDDALIQLSQQQTQTVNKLLSHESSSIFNFPSTKPTIDIDKQQRAVHENINFLASMTVASTPITPESPWQTSNLHSNGNLQRKLPSVNRQHHPQQQNLTTQSPSKTVHANISELMENLNDLCYRAFDELNALIQEQRWLQNYLNINSTTTNSPLANIGSTNCCSSRILIVPEYLIFKCKKTEMAASHIYELLAVGRPELRLRDLMFVFKSWKESITNSELIHQEEDTKLRMTIEHPHSYYMNDSVIQAAFDQMFYAIRQLGNMTQQARAAFQYATLNVFQMASRQQQNSTSSNITQLANATALAQLQAMQQQKSSSIHRIGSSLHTSP